MVELQIEFFYVFRLFFNHEMRSLEVKTGMWKFIHEKYIDSQLYWKHQWKKFQLISFYKNHDSLDMGSKFYANFQCDLPTDWPTDQQTDKATFWHDVRWRAEKLITNGYLHVIEKLGCASACFCVRHHFPIFSSLAGCGRVATASRIAAIAATRSWHHDNGSNKSQRPTSKSRASHSL